LSYTPSASGNVLLRDAELARDMAYVGQPLL